MRQPIYVGPAEWIIINHVASDQMYRVIMVNAAMGFASQNMNVILLKVQTEMTALAEMAVRMVEAITRHLPAVMAVEAGDLSPAHLRVSLGRNRYYPDLFIEFIWKLQLI